MESLRILQVVTIMNRGGLETMLMNYYRQMREKGIQFDFLVHRMEEGHYDREIVALGGQIYRMPPIRPGQYRRYFKKLDTFFESHREYKIVHSHMNENSGFVLRAARKAGVPCRIIHSHLSDLGLDYKYPFRLYARMSIKDHPSDYFACSARAGEWLFGKRKQRSEKVTVLHNAVNASEFRYNASVRQAVRHELGAGDAIVIGHIGRFNEQKNHKFLLQLFEQIHLRNPNTLLLLAGDGHLRSAMEEEAKRLGISGAVRFLGVREDVAALLQAMDVFLFPSLFEGLPVVLVEAQAAGLRCVVSDAITEEADITGRVSFLSLNQPIDVWCDAVLGVTYEHVDTGLLLRESGYDTASMADWLSDYYRSRISPRSSGGVG
ncbi:glycosyltransferase family 1 protein [Paenibacillus sp. strain BS8-2]